MYFYEKTLRNLGVERKYFFACFVQKNKTKFSYQSIKRSYAKGHIKILKELIRIPSNNF